MVHSILSVGEVPSAGAWAIEPNSPRVFKVSDYLNIAVNVLLRFNKFAERVRDTAHSRQAIFHHACTSVSSFTGSYLVSLRNAHIGMSTNIRDPIGI